MDLFLLGTLYELKNWNHSRGQSQDHLVNSKKLEKIKKIQLKILLNLMYLLNVFSLFLLPG